MDHWHAYAYTGHEVPPDSQAKDPNAAVMPRELDVWFRKPKSMLGGTFSEAKAAYGWLAAELAEYPAPPAALPVETHLEHAAGMLQLGQDAYVGYYSANGRIVIRAVLTCPRGRERCPDPPR